MKILIPSLIVLILAAVALSQQLPETQQKPQSTTSPTPQITPDENFPEPTTVEKKGTNLVTYTNFKGKYKLEYPKDWTGGTIFPGSTLLVKSPDYKESADPIPTLEAGGHLMVTNLTMEVKDIKEVVSAFDKIKNSATNINYIKIAGYEAVQYDQNFEKTTTFNTTILGKTKQYLIQLRFADEATKQELLPQYQAVLTSFTPLD